MSDERLIHTAVYNSLEEQIAVIDGSGCIVDVNQAWIRFGAANGLPSEQSCMGDNYLETLFRSVNTGDHLAAGALQGISAVLEGKRESFSIEYPCHSPDEKRWFTMRIVPLSGAGSDNLFVVSHHNITARKLAELKVQDLAMHDPLTSLANRRAFNLFFDRELKTAKRAQTPLTLMVADIDHFKLINDEFGHAAGDQCLALFATALSECARRPNDLAARIGGDEFALVLGTTDQAHALHVAEQFRSSLHALPLPFAPGRFMATSIGLIAKIPEKTDTMELFLQHADRALYAAKSAGRNRVHSAF